MATTSTATGSPAEGEEWVGAAQHPSNARLKQRRTLGEGDLIESCRQQRHRRRDCDGAHFTKMKFKPKINPSRTNVT
jgi:hypothetical protein